MNMPQVEEHDPPPNPAKFTDSRCADYIRKYGDESWELDALEPSLIVSLVRNAVHDLQDRRAWAASAEEQQSGRALLRAVADNWDSVVEHVDGL